MGDKQNIPVMTFPIKKKINTELFIDGKEGKDGPWPEPTRAYFWPAVN